ncbi:MAG: glycosyltransferase family 2 protein [Muribaculaceae bacterium]|nr:glycosyltransferase family 2 protein [Muribaculaceae bacterium]
MTRKPVAVIILNWNGEKLLKRFLPSVVEHTPERLSDVIVADNGSTDGSVGLLEQEFPSVKLLRFEENLGFAEGYNRAIRETELDYDYTVLLNSDVMVDDDWLTPLYDFMNTHREVGAVQPKLLSVDNPKQFEYAGASGGFLDRHGFPYCRGRIFDTVESDHGQYDTPMEVHWASGACLMVDNSVYLKAGGLDSKFFAHMEEIDLCWRIRLMGKQIWAVPYAHIYHLGGGSLPASNPRKTYLNFRNNLLMLHKNLPDSVRAGLLLRRRLLDTVAWAKFMATGDFANAGAILKAHRDFSRMRKEYNDHPKMNLLNVGVNIIFDYYVRSRKTWNALEN